MDTILIKELEVYAYHGVFPEEKRQGQRFLLDVTLHLDLSRAGQTDDLADTVSYADVTETVRAAMTARSYDLIERAATCVAEAVLAAYPPVAAVTVRLIKPDAPVDAAFAYMAVEIHRERK